MTEPKTDIPEQQWKILDKRRFLFAVMEELGGDAHISFEGDLSKTRLSSFSKASSEETLILKRNTLHPIQDFIVLPLESDLIKPICSSIGGTIPASILHIQIEKNGHLVIGLYDNFHPEAIFLGSELSASLIHQLQVESIMRRFTPSN